ncbi:VPS4-associated protein 1 [Podospora fimiseda]|uniref:VPS4-associated protein 1 n=1 Tax=Podospora fimiseda TaxID=252190 RepID=A0AAN6YN83_9PEZI|nr:VPS4-associated protein 1 [Podospora fimiseda]
MSFPNVYTHRKVAETSAKSCEICFKPSTSVLITDDSKDWFYVCPAHLKDKGFCTPKIDHAAIEARKKKELEEEIERVKKEYEEKQKKKKEKEKEKDDKEKNKDGKDDANKTDNEEKDKDKTKVESPSQGAAASPVSEDDEPRVFELKETFYQQRINKKRQAEIAKRNRERLRDPSYFPSVPKNLP